MSNMLIIILFNIITIMISYFNLINLFLQFQYQFLMQKSISKPEQMKVKLFVGSKHKNTKVKSHKINKSFTKIQKTHNQLVNQYDSKKCLNTSSFQQLEYNHQRSVSQNLEKRIYPTFEKLQHCRQDKLNSYMNKVIQLTSVNGYIQEKVERLEQSNLELHICVRRLQQNNDKLIQQNKNLNNQYQKLNVQIKNKENQLLNSESHCNSLIKQYESKITIISNQNDALLDKIHNISTTNQVQKNQLKQQIIRLAQQNAYNVQDKENIVNELLNIKSTFLDEIKVQKQQNQSEIIIKNKKILQLSNTIHQRQLHIICLENKYAQIQNLKQNCQRNNQYLQQQINRFKKKESQSVEQKLRLESLIKKNDANISQLRTKLQQSLISKLELQNKFIKIDFKREDLEKQLTKQIQNSKNIFNQLQLELRQKDNTLGMLQNQINEITQQNKIYRSIISEKQNNLQKCTILLNQKQKDISNLQITLNQLKIEIESLNNEKNQVIDHIENYYDKILKLQLYIGLQNKIRASLQQKIELLQNQIKVKQAKLNHQISQQQPIIYQNKKIKQSLRSSSSLEMDIQRSKFLISEKRYPKQDKNLISKSSIYQQFSYYLDSNKHSKIQLLKNDGIQNELSVSIFEIGNDQSFEIQEDILKQQQSNFEKRIKYFR